MDIKKACAPAVGTLNRLMMMIMFKHTVKHFKKHVLSLFSDAKEQIPQLLSTHRAACAARIYSGTPPIDSIAEES
jgi:hypothetical protein